jgi:hypothetical protein
MHLTALETDLLGDLAGDDHSLHEMFAFVRHHHPAAADEEVLRIGRELLATWVARRSLVLAGDGPMWGAAQSTSDLVPLIDRLGTDATHFFVGSSWLRLGPQAYLDIDWLPPAS